MEYKRNRPTGRTVESQLNPSTPPSRDQKRKASRARAVQRVRDAEAAAKAADAATGIKPVGSGLKSTIGRKVGEAKASAKASAKAAKAAANKFENKVIRDQSKVKAPVVRAAGIVAGSALTRRQRIKNATPIDRSKLGQHPSTPKPKNDIDWEEARKNAKPRPLPTARSVQRKTATEHANDILRENRLSPGEDANLRRMMKKAREEALLKARQK